MSQFDKIKALGDKARSGKIGYIISGDKDL
jgi:hypothetical protein